MQTQAVSPDATGLPSFITDPANRVSRGQVSRAKRVDPESATRIVIFRQDEPTPGTIRITAVFPCEPAMDGQMLGYTADEGHMSCTRLWFDLSRPATAEQCADLAARLRKQGHSLDIRHRLTPAMDTTRAWREEEERKAERREAIRAAEEAEAAEAVQANDNAEPAPDPEAPTLRLLGAFNCEELRRETGRFSPPVPVDFRADPAEPLRAVAVFTLLLPDWEPGHLAYTMDGLAIVSDAWIEGSIPAQPKGAKEVATVLRAAVDCRLTTRYPLSPERREVAERRRARNIGREETERLQPYIDTGRAAALACGAFEPRTTAFLIAHTLYGVGVDHLSRIYSVSPTAVRRTIEDAQARRRTDWRFNIDVTCVAQAAQHDLQTQGRPCPDHSVYVERADLAA